MDAKSFAFRSAGEARVGRDEPSPTGPLPDEHQCGSELERVRGAQRVNTEEALGSLAHGTECLDLRPLPGQQLEPPHRASQPGWLQIPFSLEAVQRRDNFGARERPHR